MKLDHLKDNEKKLRADNYYDPRGFVWQSSGFELLDAVGLALCIQRELTAASVLPDFKRVGAEIVDRNWTDVIEWIANPNKDEDDHAVYASFVLTPKEIRLLDDHADVLAPIAKGITRASFTKFKARYKTAAQKAEERAAAKRAKETGEPIATDDEEEDTASKGVSIVVCDDCEEFAYVPNGFSSKKCNFTLGCEGILVKPPKVEREWTTKKKEAAARKAAKDAAAKNGASDLSD